MCVVLLCIEVIMVSITPVMRPVIYIMTGVNELCWCGLCDEAIMPFITLIMGAIATFSAFVTPVTA